MGIAYLVITILLAAIVTFSGIGKIRHDPRIVQVIHELIGVPLKYFPLLAACELAGALGVVLGIWWPLLVWQRVSASSSTLWAHLCRICV